MGDRTTNRPTEDNSLDDRYARVIADELMPALNKEFTIAKDPERRGIGGASSGAIAAFTGAWERPNDFRKVLSLIGSFTNLRGGHAYADIVRKSEKKPIRIYLQDGRNDNRGVGRGGTYDPLRDWFLQNVRLKDALTEKGYDVNFQWGIGRHGQKHIGRDLVVAPQPAHHVREDRAAVRLAHSRRHSAGVSQHLSAIERQDPSVEHENAAVDHGCPNVVTPGDVDEV